MGKYCTGVSFVGTRSGTITLDLESLRDFVNAA
jgi:hypothetical protein